MWVCLTLSLASAHELRPAYLELREGRPGEFSVLWKTPMIGDARLALQPEFSGEAKVVTPVTTRTPPGAAIQQWSVCAPTLRGQTVRVRGLEATMTDALVRIEFADGPSWTGRLTPRQPATTIPVRRSSLSVAAVYFKLGVDHILTGVDHLLFVLALILITQQGSGEGEGARGGQKLRFSMASRHWRLIKTVTAFTVSHSLTLTAATLGFVHVPQRPVEAVIALSIVFVASEIVRRQGQVSGQRGTSSIPLSLTYRAPWVVAFLFGLLHGLGFAGGLSEAGLPDGHIPAALLFFSIGVEAGHFLFIAAVLALIASASRAAEKFCPSFQRSSVPKFLIRFAPPYAIGTIAMFWVIQRTAAF